MGAFNTVWSQRACLAADAVTLLSANFATTYGGALASRTAASTSYHLSIITGIVPAQAGEGSGGLANALRLMEDWTGQVVSFYGSLAVLYASETAVASWQFTEGSAYAPPLRRDFFYDTVLLSALPPGTPEVNTVIRTRWEILPAGIVP
jgi:predicted outer membrane repeat protein